MNDDWPRPLTEKDLHLVLRACHQTRYVSRNKVIVLLTVDAGLTVTEISDLLRRDITWNGEPHRHISVHGRYPRIVPMSDRLFQEVNYMLQGLAGHENMPLILPERDQDGYRPMMPHSIANRLFVLFSRAGILDATARSGRRAFIEKALHFMPDVVGATVQDVQALAGLKRPESLLPYAAKERHRDLIRAMMTSASNHDKFDGKDAAPKISAGRSV